MTVDAQVFGRETVLAAAGGFLEVAALRPAVLALAGEPGIGKSTVFQAVVGAAHDRGHRVLSSRPARSESRLTYVGLSDMLASVEEAVLATLPAPQRHALEVGLMRAAPSPHAVQPQAIAMALLTTLRALARAGPVLVAVDDLQWLDSPTRRLLEFALRRMVAEPVGLFATVRAGDAGPARALLRAVPAERLTVLTLDGLAPAALRQVLATRLGQDLPRPVVGQVVRTADGNPLFAIEIARAVLEHPDELGASGVPPLPEDLRQLLVRRLRRLPAASQRALLSAAAQRHPNRSTVDADALLPAERAGVVAVDRAGRVTFSHPLLASAIYGSAPAATRRGVHRELAGQVADPEERARHLALGAAGPDLVVAAALADAARQAVHRGAPGAAAELLELAVDAAPPDDNTLRLGYTVAAAESHFHAGDRIRARELATAVAAGAPAGELAGRALRLLGMVRYHEDSY
ncbi:MAG TPA: AAA family ATPase, partial [Micromonosporaceae bacterium]|nr:AAA family ATPase [Micromonosporaceae bacterium]